MYFKGQILAKLSVQFVSFSLKAIIKPQYVDQIPKAVKVSDHIL